MPTLKQWDFETTIIETDTNGEEYKREISIPVRPSKKDGYNWECKLGRNLLRFKTKKAARKNLNRIVSE